VPERPGRQLAYDEAGRLYEAGVRSKLAEVLDPGQLAIAETLFAIGHAAAGMRQVTRQLGSLLDGVGDDPVRVIRKLYERQDTGIAAEELIGDFDIGPDIAGARQALAELERHGLVERSAGSDDRDVVRLTRQGLELMEEGLRQRADALAVWTDGISPEQMAVARHVCLQLAANAGMPATSVPERRPPASAARVDPGPVRLGQDLLAYVRRNSGAVHVELRAAQPPHLALGAMKAAVRALFQVPHPLEPEGPFISFASEVSEGDRGPGFWFDAADAAGFDGIPEALINAICAALAEHGITGGELTYPEAGAR
jgi:DNA-binding MarR family transcriptional regulator